MDGDKDAPVYGDMHLKTSIDGIELLKEGGNIAAERMLGDDDFKRIKLIKMKMAAKHVDRKRFADSASE